MSDNLNFTQIPSSAMNNSSVPPKPLPLAGLRVVEFTHMVMGPTCGMVLAGLGYDAAQIESLQAQAAVA